MTLINLLDLAATTVASSVAASKAIRSFVDEQNVRFKSDGTAVTDADLAAQAIIVHALPTSIRIVGEESPDQVPNVDDFTKEEEQEYQLIYGKAQREVYGRYHRECSTSNDHDDDDQEQRLLQPLRTITANDDDGEDNGGAQQQQQDQEEQQLPVADAATTTTTTKASLFEYMVDPSRVSVYIDPLDGTKAYTKGDYDSVTTLIAIVVDNEPCFGVITKPFGYDSLPSILHTKCVTVYGGSLLNGVFVAGSTECTPTKQQQPSSSSLLDNNTITPTTTTTSPLPNMTTATIDTPTTTTTTTRIDRTPRAVISSSRSKGIVQDFVDHLASEGVVHQDPILVSGAGEKSLRLILSAQSEALWFFPKPGTSRWDVAATDALLRQFGGRVTDKFGHDLDYYSTSRDDAENLDGIIASNNQEIHQECVRIFLAWWQEQQRGDGTTSTDGQEQR